jgi:hypothetical protein
MRHDIDEHDALLRRRAEPVDELPLFAAPRARTTDPEPSHLADTQNAKAARAHQYRAILLALQAHGPANADQLDARIGWRETTAGRRLSELRVMGHVMRTGEQMATRSGGTGEVYTLTALGAQQAAA